LSDGPLDAETARIDALIEKKRRLAELLEERWASQIATLSTSDQVFDVAIRRLFQVPIGGTWGGDKGTADRDVRSIRGTDFNMSQLRADGKDAPVRGVTESDFLGRQLRKGDLIIEKSGGGDSQPVGRVVEWSGEVDAVPTNFAARLRSRQVVNPRFAAYLLKYLYDIGTTRAWIRQTTGIQNLDLGGFLSTKVSIPDVSIQEEIAKQLDNALEAQLALAEAVFSQIALMQEHRQALITAAVTGELPIPEVAA
jgi:type I restriction enzyme S subunit